MSNNNFPKDFTFEEAKKTIVSLRRQLYAVPFLTSSAAIVFCEDKDIGSLLIVGGLAFLLSAIVLYVLLMIETLNQVEMARLPAWLLPLMAFALPIIIKLLFLFVL